MTSPATLKRAAAASQEDSQREWKVEVVDPVCDPAWDQTVSKHPEVNIFHSRAWARVLSRTYQHKPVYLRISRAGRLTAVVPIMEIDSRVTGRRGVALPFSDFCQPLRFESLERAFLIETFRSISVARNWRYFEVRGFQELRGTAVSHVAFLTHTLSLSGGPEECLKRFSSPNRRAIRKAQRTPGLTSELSRTRDSMLDFYQLHVRTRRRHGLPPQPQSFFLNIFDEVIKPGRGFIALARWKARPIAAAVFFHFSTQALFKFGASDEKYQGLRANNLVMWKGIEALAQDGGLATLNLGRTSLGDEGLRRFKLGWGSSEDKIEYHRFEILSGEWKSGHDNVTGFHNSIFRRLPLIINRFAGSVIYPHLH
jgi:Acetyltransferase (GNAT) domain